MLKAIFMPFISLCALSYARYFLMFIISYIKKAVLIIAREIFRDEELFDTQKALEVAHIKTTVASSALGNCQGKLGAVAVSTMTLEEIIVDQFDAIVFIVDGKADIKIDGVSNILEAGENIIMPANVPHALIAVKKFKMVLTMLKNK